MLEKIKGNLKDPSTIYAILYALGMLGLKIWANHDATDAPDINNAIMTIGLVCAGHLGALAKS